MHRTLFAAIAAVALTACSVPSGHFQIEGQFKGLNQGQFLLYSIDARHERIDTLRLNNGKVAYDIPLEDTVVMMLLFPNFSELPIIAAPDTKISIQGDATHLRETEVKGGVDNDVLTAWRKLHAGDSQNELERAAAQYIEEHPASPASTYLLRRYLLQGEQPLYSEATRLLRLMLKAAPGNMEAVRMRNLLTAGFGKEITQTLPPFSARDIKGNNVGASKLKQEVNIVYTWSSWDSKSLDNQRKLRRLKKQYGGRVALMGFCLDADTMSVRYTLRYDSITWTTICDGQMFANPALHRLRLLSVPDNVVYDSHGKELARSLTSDEIDKHIKEWLK